MSELLEKISTYNIFNYLFPGVLYAYTLNELFSINFLQDNLLVGFFLYYFIGLVISRVGSLFIDPILEKVRFIKKEPYKNYIKISKKDDKIDLLSEVNNMYRTIFALILSLLCTALYIKIENHFGIVDYRSFVAAVFLLILFLFAYRKQTKIIVSRINGQKK